ITPPHQRRDHRPHQRHRRRQPLPRLRVNLQPHPALRARLYAQSELLLKRADQGLHRSIVSPLATGLRRRQLRGPQRRKTTGSTRLLRRCRHRARQPAQPGQPQPAAPCRPPRRPRRNCPQYPHKCAILDRASPPPKVQPPSCREHRSMPAIKPTCVRDLKLRINIVDVVSRVATLKKAGSRYKGLCPFHNEKSPSFHVDPDKGFYKCFGCGQAGDIISFVRETEQLSFTEAIEALGQRFNIPVEYEEGSGPSREERSLRQELFDLHELAAEHFHQAFKADTPHGDWMRAYWTEQRRFSPELAEEFKIGLAPPADSSLAAALLKRKFSEDALRQCGLFFVNDGAVLTLGALKPRFRGRLMIPIRDHQGRVVAFTARQTDLTPENDPAREAKYVNSPETPIFSKSHLLFNLDHARKHA